MRNRAPIKTARKAEDKILGAIFEELYQMAQKSLQIRHLLATWLTSDMGGLEKAEFAHKVGKSKQWVDYIISREK